MVSFAVRHASDTPLTGKRVLPSLRAGSAYGCITATKMHFGIATSYQIDEAAGDPPITVPIVFPGAKYDALDYTPTRPGYRFTGWYTDMSGGTQVMPSDEVRFGVSPIYAHWQDHVTVTFDATTNGGAMPDGWTAPYYFAGQPYGMLPVPTHPTLNFGGWYDSSGTRVTESSIVPQNGASLTARYVDSFFSVDLNGEWREQSPNTNPDSSAYAGVYESFSNWNVDGSTATMSIRVVGYSSFSLYIRSDAESDYDYCWCEAPTGTVVAEMSPEEKEARRKIAEYREQGYYVEEYNEGDGWIYYEVYDDSWNLIDSGSFQSSNPESTQGDQQSDTSISGYKLVTYNFDDASENSIYVHYMKDSSVNEGEDRGYVLIPLT